MRIEITNDRKVAGESWAYGKHLESIRRVKANGGTKTGVDECFA